jgi:enoyl-CoA hydratase
VLNEQVQMSDRHDGIFVSFYDRAWSALTLRLSVCESRQMPDAESSLQFMRLDRSQPGVAVVTLDRPERLNALSWPMVDEFLAVCNDLANDQRLRVVILTGAGRGFCAGLDLQDRDDALGGDDDVYLVSVRQEKIAHLAIALRAMPQPVIAAVNGAAAGGGLALALASDLRLAAPEASFHASFIKVGLSGCDAGVSYLLPRLVGLGIASELMLTGRRVDADEAARIGLVNRLVPQDRLLDAAHELAHEIAANSPFGVWMTKKGLQCNVDAPSLEVAVELENRTQVLATRTADMTEAVAAHSEKRDAVFQWR